MNKVWRRHLHHPQPQKITLELQILMHLNVFLELSRFDTGTLFTLTEMKYAVSVPTELSPPSYLNNSTNLKNELAGYSVTARASDVSSH